jgi:hypothetical protein
VQCARQGIAIDALLSLVDSPNALEQHLGRGLLQHESHHSELYCLRHFFVTNGCRQKHTAAALVSTLQRAKDIESAQVRHPQIEDEHVRVVLLDCGDRRPTVTAGGDDREVVLPLQQLPESVEHYRMIVDHNDANGHT